jgi:hypothetical protein
MKIVKTLVSVAALAASVVGISGASASQVYVGYPCAGYVSNWHPSPYSSRAVSDLSCSTTTHAVPGSTGSTGYYSAETVYSTSGYSTHTTVYGTIYLNY